MDLPVNLWDVAAALVILREAGAGISDFMAGGAASGNPIIACAPGLTQAWSNLPGISPPIAEAIKLTS